VVIVDRGSGRFESVEVRVGGEEGGRTEILSGIEPGTRVVASGQFLIDSEASLRGAERRMDAGPAMGAGTTQAHRAEGVVKQADAKSLLISHGPVASAGMGAMTMEFVTPRSGLPAGLKAGDRVEFDFVINPDGTFETTRVTPKAGAKP
jgi:Cu(I)/Ag(I) efflux system membrane fusion protein